MLLEVKKQSGFSRNGFTLVEIIVVMGLVAALAVLSVGGYLQYRKSTILNLSADSIIAQIYSQRNKAMLGYYKGQRADEIRTELDKTSENFDAETVLEKDIFESKCFTVLFEKSADGKFLAYISQKDFSGKKVFGIDSWEYEGCKDFTNDTVIQKNLFELDSLIKIDNVSVGNFSGSGAGNAILDSLEIKFLPPDGEIHVLQDGKKVGSADVGMKIDISYGDNNPDYEKSVFFDFVSGVGTISK